MTLIEELGLRAQRLVAHSEISKTNPAMVLQVERDEAEAMHPSWKIKNLRRRVNRARNFPYNTCPCSRHLHIMADKLGSGKQYFMFAEEPEHCAMSMYGVLEALWKARTELAQLRSSAT